MLCKADSILKTSWWKSGWYADEYTHVWRSTENFIIIKEFGKIPGMPELRLRFVGGPKKAIWYWLSVHAPRLCRSTFNTLKGVTRSRFVKSGIRYSIAAKSALELAQTLDGSDRRVRGE